MQFKVGDRVLYNDAVDPRYGEGEDPNDAPPTKDAGTVKGVTADGQYEVRWDAGVEEYVRDYLLYLAKANAFKIKATRTTPKGRKKQVIELTAGWDDGFVVISGIPCDPEGFDVHFETLSEELSGEVYRMADGSLLEFADEDINKLIRELEPIFNSFKKEESANV